MKVGQIKRVVNIRKRKSGNIKQVTYDLCTGHEPVDPMLQKLTGNGQTHCNIIRTFKTREEAEQYVKENLSNERTTKSHPD